MPDPTGRWVNRAQWQCPRCAWVNARGEARCQECDPSVRPSPGEPVRPLDPLDLIGKGKNAPVGDSSPPADAR